MKFLLVLEFLVFILCLSEVVAYHFVTELSVLAEQQTWFILGLSISLLLLIITIGIRWYRREVGVDIIKLNKSDKEKVKDKVLFDEVTKRELGIIPGTDHKHKIEDNIPSDLLIEAKPAEEKPVEPVAEKEAKVEEKPAEAPAEEKPVEAPVEAAPVEEKPAEEAPVEPVVEEKPAEAPVEETPVEPAVEPETKVEEAPVEEPVAPKGPMIKLSHTVLAPFQIFDDVTYSIGQHWADLFKSEVNKQYFKDMVKFLGEAYENKNVYPPKEDLMKCFEYCDFDNTRVVIIGKFPFYRKNQADGLAYSTRLGMAPNQTTSIIIKEAISDVGIPAVKSGSLVNWAHSGVLLLNSVMTAPSDKPASHSECGWVTFTNKIIESLNKDPSPKVFVLWGEYAQSLKPLITNEKHLILEAPNPSPLSAANGFYGSKPFSKINKYLEEHNIEPIDWNL